MPTIKQVNDSRIEQFKQQIRATIAAGELDTFRGVLADLEREHEVPAIDIAAALARMARGDAPFLLTPPPRR